MGMTIQPQTQPNFTDGTGCFREGMTMEEARDARSLFNGIWRDKDALKEFWRMDKDFDGVLSHDEISEELQENVKKKFNDFKTDTLWTVLSVLNYNLDKKVLPKFAKLWMFYGCCNIVLGLLDLYKMSKYAKRCAQGHN